ncbi:MAG: hypothetical protein ACREO1_14800 [Arenimonas sp.]
MKSVLSSGELFCKLDALDAESEYGETPSARLIGVGSKDFNVEAFSEGITAYTIEIPLREIPSEISEEFCPKSSDCNNCASQLDKWIKVTFLNIAGEDSYLFPTFDATEPARISVESMSFENGFTLPQFPIYSPQIVFESNANWTCSSFEVGQGMSSLIYSDTDALLIDAGAGTPIKRSAYINGMLTKNDLLSLVQTRNVTFILSHGDADHWRMLGWDSSIRARIREYVVPHNMRQITFFDKTVKPWVRQCSGDVQLALGNQTTIGVLRTVPTQGRATSNNDGIVILFEKNSKRVLIAGDCVYSELSRDTNTSVAKLNNNAYEAIVVPHHGDLASAVGVPNAARPGASIAFFSAGNHLSYQHPTPKSISSHTNAGFKNVVNKHSTGIVEHILL